MKFLVDELPKSCTSCPLRSGCDTETILPGSNDSCYLRKVDVYKISEKLDTHKLLDCDTDTEITPV